MSEISTVPPSAHFKAEDFVIHCFLALYGTLLVSGVIVNAIFMIAMFRGRKTLGQVSAIFDLKKNMASVSILPHCEQSSAP